MHRQLRFQATVAHLPVTVQPIAFGRAVTNLISNALRYGNAADVSVQRDAARNLDQAGFGFGLAIVADILKRNAAALDFEDREDGGLRAVIRVKAAKAWAIPSRTGPAATDFRMSPAHDRDLW